MKKNLLITFDYELFLGPKSGRANTCLLEPTRAIIKILRQFDVKAVFFVDTTYLYTLEKYSKQYDHCRRDLELVTEQIRDLVLAGYYVFPHLHPHWLDAVYLRDQHEFVLKEIQRYRFHNLDQADREHVFSECVRIMDKIIHEVKPDYKINGYRAGGWSIQPFEDIKPFFEKYNILYDFSVMHGTFQFSNAQYFDFSDAPQRPVYRFSEDVVKEDPNGPFIEISSSVIKLKPYVKLMDRVHRKLLFKLKDHTYGKGIGQQSKVLKDLNPRSLKGHPSKDKIHEPIATELMSVVKLPSYLDFFRENDYMQFVSHPKMVSNHNLYTLEKFLEMIYHDYTIETDFQKIVKSYVRELEIVK